MRGRAAVFLYFVGDWGGEGLEPSRGRKMVGRAGSVPEVAGLESTQLRHIKTASLSLAFVPASVGTTRVTAKCTRKHHKRDGPGRILKRKAGLQ